MRIQVFSEYLQLAQAGKVKFLACPKHEEHKPAIFDLIHKMEDDDKISLNCLACGYKMYPGYVLYNEVLKAVTENNEPKKQEDE